MIEKVVFSSQTGLPASYLHGFAFSGSDIILGDDGYSSFCQKTGKTVVPGDDGGFLVINKTKDTYKIGTDFGGYAKVYYYANGDDWAFSTSLVDLAEHLKSNGKRLKIDPVGAASLVFDGSLGEQPVFHKTPIQSISLLPRNQAIEVRNGLFRSSFRIVDVKPAVLTANADRDYYENLKDYLDTWSGRFCTVVNSNLHCICDVTGGLDSRAIFALILRAGRLAELDLSSNVYFYSNVSADRDFKVASDIAEHYRLSVNSREQRYFPWHNSEDSYQTWVSTCLYGSWPVRMPGFRRSNSQMWVCGNGGESHRWARWRSGRSGVETVDQLVAKHRHNFENQENFESVRAEIRRDSARLREDDLQPRNSVVNHYRNFRERFHHGRRTEAINSVAPLSDSRLAACSRLLTDPELQSQKVFADIVHNSAADLNTLPMKSTSYTNFAGLHPERLTNLDESPGDIDMSGQVFGEIPERSTGRFVYRDALALMIDDFNASKDAALDLGLATQQSLQNSSQMLDETMENGRFAKPVDAKQIAITILAGRMSQWI